MSLSPGTTAVFEPQGTGVSARIGGRTVFSPVLELVPDAPNNGPACVTLGTAGFRGLIRVCPAPAAGGSPGTGGAAALLAVNVVPLEEYLYGVVGSEMPADWPEEALKAQAVACRSFALSCARAAIAKGAPYDLTATTDGQVYGGLSRENAAAAAAVQSTRGIVLTSAGESARAVFHSSSSGHTENSEFVWSAASPYLKGVPDPDDSSPHRSWEFRATAGEIERLLSGAGIDVGAFRGLRCLEQGVSGRWSKVSVMGSKGSAVVRGIEFRRALGLKSTWFSASEQDPGIEPAVVRYDSGQALYALSASGQVSMVSPAYRAPEVSVLCYRTIPRLYVFNGRGWGHGVGMSQWGARTLAERGYKYPDILEHYYLNTRLEEYAR